MTAVGRADLLRAWDESGEVGLASMARLLGFEEHRLDPEPGPKEVDAKAEAAPFVESTRDSKLAPTPFWYLAEIEYLEPEPAPVAPPTEAKPIGLAGLGYVPGSPPPTPPLATDARLLPVLRRRLASEVPSREVDVDALAERWSRGLSVCRVPFRPLSAWAPEIVVLVDRSPRLIPFWDDQDRLLARLRRRLGRAAVHEVLFLEGYSFPWRFGRYRLSSPPVVPGVPVLVLGDLGFLADQPRRALWRRVGERLRRSGASCSALVTCPANRWSSGAARSWDLVEWEKPSGAPRVGRAPSDVARRVRVERLLGLLAFASRLEPGLLRAVRRLLPVTAADAGTEADAWGHPEVSGALAPVGALGADLRARLQARFAAESDDVKRRVVAALRAFRCGLPQEIWLDEVFGLAVAGELPDGVLDAEEIAAARDLWRRAAETVDGTGAQPGVDRAVKAFVRRSLGERQPRAVWDDEELRPVLWRAWEAAWEGVDAPWPFGVGPDVLGVPGGAVRRFQIWHEGDALRVTAVGETTVAGSPLATFESAHDEIGVSIEGERFASRHPIGRSSFIPLPDEVPSLVLRSERTVVTLRRLERPTWASAMGRDRFGLWASFEVEGVVQRLRYISPGRFFMGSPEDEPGRLAGEGPRHLKTVPRGFWLADTPCTQALWQAVTGKNPSHFQTPDRPVEQVSWEGCQEFFGLLEQRVPGSGARLPTEAEWEYACRAETETATYAGPMEILGERDAPVLDAIAWYGGNSGVNFDLEEGYDSDQWKEKQYEHAMAGTRPVALKESNPWGLYDMLGNVYEWCEDVWRSGYDAEPEGTFRVGRGGSWFSYARDVRAAYRNLLIPADRWLVRGFRFARDQSAFREGAEPQGAERLSARSASRRGAPPAAEPPHGRRP